MTNFTVNVPALEKLLDYAASGIGSIAGPMLASWRARKEANALTIQAEGQASALQTIAAAQVDARSALGNQDGLVQTEVSICDTISQRIQFQEEKRQRNLESVVRQSATELDDKSVPDEEPDHDWTARFFADVQDVSSEDLQLLWAKILAGQVERPGSTSIRTLGVLRSMTHRDAEYFRQFCAFTWFIEGARPLIFELEDEIYQRNGVNYGRLIHLESLGLIKLHDNKDLWIPSLHKSMTARYFDKTVTVSFSKNSDNLLYIGQSAFTSVGIELFEILDAQEVDGFYEYICDKWSGKYRALG